MSAMGRLWRRAPAWRLCVIVAGASLALALMFPPPRPDWTRRFGAHASDATAAHFTPQPATASPGYGSLEVPPIGPGRSGTIAFAGHRITLPSGTWQDLVVGRDGSAAMVQLELLGRIESGRLTGVMLAAAPNPLGHPSGSLNALAPCFEGDTISRTITPEPATANPLTHECWTLSRLAASQLSEGGLLTDLFKRGLAKAEILGGKLPAHLLALRYMRSAENGWLSVLVMVPDTRGEDRRVAGWAPGFVAALHKGFGEGA